MYFILIALFLIFTASSLAKLFGLEFETAAFARWGYPLWFMYATGIAELISAITLINRRTRIYGAATLCLIMIGATVTHAWHQEWDMFPVAFSILLAAVWLLRKLIWWRRFESRD